MPQKGDNVVVVQVIPSAALEDRSTSVRSYIRWRDDGGIALSRIVDSKISACLCEAQ